MRSVHSVSPLPRSVHREFAEAMIASNICLRNKAIGTVYISDQQGAGCRLHRIGLGQIGCRCATDEGRIIGPQNIHSQDLAGAINSLDGQCVGICLPVFKFIVGSAHGVRPSTVSINGERAVTTSAQNTRLRDEAKRAVHVGHGNRTRDCLQHIVVQSEH